MKARRFSKILAGLVTSLILLVMVGTSAKAAIGDTTRISVASDETQGNNISGGFIAIVVNGNHSCALTVNGAVKCWGVNYADELGDGTTTDHYAPVNVAGLSGSVAAIADGGDYICVLTSSGGVKCRGNNYYGQLGDGTTTTRTKPTDVVGLQSNVTIIAAGDYYTCAITMNGAVKCWGQNGSGQLGDGSTTDRNIPVDVVGMSSGVTAITAGGPHTCALTTGGGVKCWGRNDAGQLGDGSTIDRHTPVDVVGLSSDVTAIAAGGLHTCALTKVGGVKCWGFNGWGELGDGSLTNRNIPVDVIGLQSGVIAISSGESYTCALTINGTVKCWGGNNEGQLGDGTRIGYRNTPVDVVGLSSVVVAITAGSFSAHTCALTNAGAIKCWGDDTFGALGNGPDDNFYIPSNYVIGLSSGVSAIANGDSHTCSVTTNGGVKCWGLNDVGEIGDGSNTVRYTPVDVFGLSSGVTAVTAGGMHSCALNSGGGVKCWGYRLVVGDGTDNMAYTPVNVVGLSSGVVAIAAGTRSGHTCALMNTGAVKCWGFNSQGQLGDGTTINRLTPVDVMGLSSGVLAISVGSNDSCALTNVGVVKCWGANENGQLGDGTTIERHTPINVVGLSSSVTAIAAGAQHTCALTTSGAIKCWGQNNAGQLGDGTTIERHAPVDVVGLSSGGTAITAGVQHTCALTTSGAIKCWGNNELGLLGIVSAGIIRTTPVDITGFPSTVTAIAAGSYHTCALITGGGAMCWGDDEFGQLGNGMSYYHTSPVDVIDSSSTFSISGQVKNSSRNPISGVTISDGSGHTVITDSNGSYILTGLPADNYLLAPSKAGLFFTPTNRLVAIAQSDVTNQDFTGMTINCSTATATQPILLVTGWGGSMFTSRANDDNLSFLYDNLWNEHYIEGCNLFYAEGTDPSKWQDENAKAIQDDLCFDSQTVKLIYPNWTGSFDIIAHSYGGLRARAYLENPILYGKCTVNNQKPRVRNLITLGTPHDGDLPDLPLSFLLGLNGILHPINNTPALLELLPGLRMEYNLTHSQPDNVNYYFISGDSRTQSVPLPLNLISSLFPEYQITASDMAVHTDSGHALGLPSDQYPRITLISTDDVHGRSSEWIVTGLNQMASYVYPSDTFNNYIWPIIAGTYTGASAVSTLSPQVQTGEINSILTWVAQQTAPTPTTDLAQMDITSGVLTGTQLVTGSFEIANSGDTTILFVWDTGNVSLILKNPMGTIIPQDSNYASFDGGFGWIASYHLLNPQEGIWSYIISSQALTNPAIYRLAAMPAAPITVVGSLPSWLPNNSPISITAKVAYAGTTPVTNGTVSVKIQRPDSTSESISLYDDGNHQDGNANDGLFGGSYSNTSLGGIYSVLITATGSYNGETYARTATANFTIAPATASVGTNYADHGVDDNSDGVYEWLEVSTPVVVTQPGKYMISAELYAGSVFIGQTFTESTLDSGPQDIALRFAGKDIFKMKLDGPYTLRNLMLFDENDATVLIQAIDNAYTMGAYQYLQFGYQIYLPLVIR